MPFYHFHLDYGSFAGVSTGEPFPDAGAAKAHARLVAAEMARNSSKDVCVTVTDQHNNKLFDVFGAG